MKRPVLTYANVMSTLGVFIALGGTSYAVARNSIGTAQLKNNAVTSGKVRNGALTAKDLSANALKAGPRGPRGQIGPTGATGPAGPTGSAEAWKPLPFINGWKNYGSIWELGSYRKDQLGIVHLRGLITFPGGPTGGSVIAVLPPGYRPQNGRLYAVHTGEGPPPGVGRVNVLADGQIQWTSGAGGASNYTTLESISFDTD
jgi:hypothetical protein